MLLLPGLTICGHNCLLTAEWMSASKIVCRVGQAKNDKGDIIVTTKSGGKGTSTVSFKLLKPEKIGKTRGDFIPRKAYWPSEANPGGFCQTHLTLMLVACSGFILVTPGCVS